MRSRGVSRSSSRCADLHWADETVLTLIERLVEGLRALPFALFATARPELLERWSPTPGRHNLTLLNLDPLDADAVAALAGELLGPDVDPAVIDILHDRSGGNPFFVEELAALLRESGPADSPSTIPAGRLPATLRGLVAARLDALGAEERTVLEDCAVVGGSGSIDAVRALSSARGHTVDVEEALTRLDGRELVDVEGDDFSFPSEVVRAVAYGTLAKAERARRHAALADWYASNTGSESAAERAAYHYGTVAELLAELGPVTGMPDDFTERALPVLEHAASAAVGAENWRNAARLYDQCLRLLPPDTSDEKRWQLLLGRALAHAEYRDLPTAHTDLDEVLDDTPPTRASGRGHSRSWPTSSRWRGTTPRRSPPSTPRSSCGASSRTSTGSPPRSARRARGDVQRRHGARRRRLQRGARGVPPHR